MKVGILSDIHGNADALAPVLAEALQKEITQLFVLGDIVGYYYHPDKVLEMLSKWKFTIIKGNHEELLEELYCGKIEATVLKARYGSGHQEALNKLSEEQLQFLFRANSSAVTKLDDVSISLNHGAVFDQSYYLYPDTPVAILDKCDDGNDFVFVGHSHYPFIHQMPHGVLVNVGSVGQSRLTGGIASWCVLDTKNRSVEMMETAYNTTLLIKEATAKDPGTPYLSNILKRKTN